MMMMEKPKEEKKESFQPKQSSKNTNDEIKDLERRINNLGSTATASTKIEKPKLVENNDLLARIKAAQQRAKEAQLKQQQELEDEKLKEESMLASLSREIDDDNDTINELPPPSFDVIEQNDEPPPPFDVLEQTISPPPTFDEMEKDTQTKQQELVPTLPPSFDTINPEIIQETNVMPSAPDFIQEEHEEDTTVDFSSLYPHITLTNEQQEQINQNSQNPYNMKELQKIIHDEQLRILNDIQTKSNDTTTTNASTDTEQNTTIQEEQTTIRPPQQTIQIAPDHYVPLHGPESTKTAINQGTAILTQCCNCKSYLHITNTATLMFCPCCQVVSPVDTSKSSARRTQEDMDRQLAQRIQDEEYANGGTTIHPNRQMRVTNNSGGWMSSFFGSSVTDYPRSITRQSEPQPQQQSQSWSEYFSSFLGSSKSTTNNATNNNNEEEAELYQALTGVNGEEQQTSLPPATIADRKPVYDCLLESANSITNSLTGTTNENHEYHGVDTTCLLDEDYNEEESNRNTVVVGGQKKKEGGDQYHLME